jgi:hypothetical protein
MKYATTTKERKYNAEILKKMIHDVTKMSEEKQFKRLKQMAFVIRYGCMLARIIVIPG